jgi:hypothetical protein
MKKRLILLDSDLEISAQYLNDRDLKFMTLHLANILSHFYTRYTGIKNIPKGYKNLSSSFSNLFVNYLISHINSTIIPIYSIYFKILCTEYFYRFQENHPSSFLLKGIPDSLFEHPYIKDTRVIKQIFDLYRNDIAPKNRKDLIVENRNRYKEEFVGYNDIRYTKRKIPNWLTERVS